MTALLELLFAIALAVVLYTYVGYGALLWLMVKLKHRKGLPV